MNGMWLWQDLLIYVSDDNNTPEGQGLFATQWNEKFEANAGKAAQDNSALREMFQMVQEVHDGMGIKIPDEPLWENCIWQYWPSGKRLN